MTDQLQKKKLFRQGSGSVSGFTLVELALVLLVIGVVSSGLIIGIPQYLDQKKREVTTERFDLLLNVLSSYTQRHYRLPCPADTVDVGAVTRGMERNGGDCLNTTSESAMYAEVQGVLPWRELGLSESDVMDGWGRYITYKPAPHLTVNTYSLDMQEDAVNNRDIHNACRNQVWFDADGTHHLNRQKALFCCNASPKKAYLGGGAMPAKWRDNAIAVAGVDDDNDPSNDNVTSSLRWTDDYDRTDVSGDNALAGDFDAVYNTDADAPLIRASGHAVTLISHGGNGSFAFLRKQDGAHRLDATVNTEDGTVTSATANVAVAERKQVEQPGFAGITGHPKASGQAHSKGGVQDNVSDDMVVFLRTDQLFAKAGDATCVRPAPKVVAPVCDVPPGGYKNITFILDNSGSMLEATDGNGVQMTRWAMAKAAIDLATEKTVEHKLANYQAPAEGEEAESLGKIGFNTFWGVGSNYHVSNYSRFYDNIGTYFRTYEDSEIPPEPRDCGEEPAAPTISWPYSIHYYRSVRDYAPYASYEEAYDAFVAARTDYIEQTKAYNSKKNGYDTCLRKRAPEIAAYNEYRLRRSENMYYNITDASMDPETETGTDVYMADRPGQIEALIDKKFTRDDFGGTYGQSTAYYKATILPASPYTGPGRGTPLIDTILSTVQGMENNDDAKSIVLLTDGTDTDSAVPDAPDYVYVQPAMYSPDGDYCKRYPTFSYCQPEYCEKYPANANCNPTELTLAAACRARTSSTCQKALYDYTAQQLTMLYPNVDLHIVDISKNGNSALNAFYAGTDLNGAYVHAGSDPSGAQLMSALMRSSGICGVSVDPESWIPDTTDIVPSTCKTSESTQEIHCASTDHYGNSCNAGATASVVYYITSCTPEYRAGVLYKGATTSSGGEYCEVYRRVCGCEGCSYSSGGGGASGGGS